MKKLFVFILFLFAVTSIFAQGQQQTQQAQTTVQRIGYVDFNVVMQQFPEAIQATSTLESLRVKYAKELDSMGNAYKNEVADIQKKYASMKPDQQRDIAAKLQAKEAYLTQFQTDKTNELNSKRDALYAPIQEKILKAIETVAKEEGYNFIFNKSGDVVLLYGEASVDMTYKVLDKLKRGK